MRFTRNIKKAFNNINNTFINTFNFNGRATISEYWDFIFFGTLILSTVIYLEMNFGVYHENTLIYLYHPDPILKLSFFLVEIPILSLTIRRLHDLNKDWFWIIPLIALYAYIPILFVAVTLIFFTQKGSVGPNKYDANNSSTKDKLLLLASIVSKKLKDTNKNIDISA